MPNDPWFFGMSIASISMYWIETASNVMTGIVSFFTEKCCYRVQLSHVLLLS
jgi:hypothetical protein